MGFQTNFIAGSEVTISGDVSTENTPSVISSTQTPVYEVQSPSSNLTLDTDVNMLSYTPSGKDLYVSSLTFSMIENSAVAFRIIAKVDGSDVWRWRWKTDTGNKTTEGHIIFPVPIKVPDGDTFLIVCNNIGATDTSPGNYKIAMMGIEK